MFLGRFTVAVAAFAGIAGLAACGGTDRSVATLPQAAAPLGAPQEMLRAGGPSPGHAQMPPQPSLRNRPPGWLSREAKTGPVVFVANTGNATITLYSAISKAKNPPAIGLISTGLTYPWGMAVDNGGDLYVANVNGAQGAAGNVVMYRKGVHSPTLTYTSGLSAPIAVAVGNDGTVYVANQNVRTPSGTFPGNVVVYPPGSTTPSETLTDPNFNTLWALAVDAGGNLYITYTGKGCCPQTQSVDEFLAGSSLPIALGLAPVGSGFEYYGAVTLDAKGNLVLGDFYQVEVWPPGATSPSQTFGQRGTPDGTSFNVSGNRLFVSDNNEGEVEEYAYPAGTLVNLYQQLMRNPEAVALRPRMPLPTRSPQPPPPTPTPSPSPTPSPTPTPVPPPGTIAVASRDSNSVGFYDAQTGTPGSQITQGVSSPYGAAFDPSGNLYVTNAGTNQVTEYAPGATSPTVTFSGIGDPWGIAVAPDGTLAVAIFGSPASILVYPANSQTPSETLSDSNVQHYFGVAIDASDDVFASYELNSGGGNCGVEEFVAGSTTPVVLPATPPGCAYALGIDNSGNLIVSAQGEIDVFAPGASMPSTRIGQGLFGLSFGVALDATQFFLYVADLLNNAVDVFTYPAGVLVDTFSSGFVRPTGIALAPSGTRLRHGRLRRAHTPSFRRVAPTSTLPLHVP